MSTGVQLVYVVTEPAQDVHEYRIRIDGAALAAGNRLLTQQDRDLIREYDSADCTIADRLVALTRIIRRVEDAEYLADTGSA